MSALLIVSLCVILIATAYLYVKNSLTYWKRRGVPFIKPSFPFGNFSNALLQRKHFGDVIADLYNETSEPFVGVYMFVQPILVVRDPKLIKDMCIKSFQHFSHRTIQANIDADPMADNILLQKGEKWKRMRQQFTPTFSSGKLKAMFQTIIDCGKSLDKHISNFADTEKSVEIRDVFACFATNVIASVAFGIEVDCIENPETEFRKYGQRIFQPSFKNMLRANINALLPKLSKWLGLRFVDKDIGDFMIETVRQNLKFRENNNVSRKDFFQLLIQLRNTGKVQDDDSNWTTKATSEQKSLTLEQMAAQAFLFFGAGFESSSSTMSFCMYELAKSPEIQQKAYEEIVNVLENHHGQLTYDSVADMKYLDYCLDESLRLHPPFPIVTRKCSKNYNIPGTNVIIEEGTPVFISSIGLHYDEKYYDEPTKFNPDRYIGSQLSNKSFEELPYMVFGEGPRNCIGMRLGKLQSKIAIVLLLQKFRFELDDQHKHKELELNPRSIVLTPLNGLNLIVYSR